jgi:hypothetical protein
MSINNYLLQSRDPIIFSNTAYMYREWAGIEDFLAKQLNVEKTLAFQPTLYI